MYLSIDVSIHDIGLLGIVAGNLECTVYLEMCFIVLGLAYLGLGSYPFVFLSCYRFKVF